MFHFKQEKIGNVPHKSRGILRPLKPSVQRLRLPSKASMLAAHLGIAMRTEHPEKGRLLDLMGCADWEIKQLITETGCPVSLWVLFYPTGNSQALWVFVNGSTTIQLVCRKDLSRFLIFLSYCYKIQLNSEISKIKLRRMFFLRTVV